MTANLSYLAVEIFFLERISNKCAAILRTMPSEKYCSKEGKLIEFGQRPRQGEKTDLQELKTQLDAGKRPLLKLQTKSKECLAL